MVFMYLTVLVLASHMMLGDTAITISSLGASGLSGDALGNRPDPYVKVWCNNAYGGRTDTIKGTHNPNWGGSFTFPNCNAGHSVKLEVWDEDLMFDDRLGTCSGRIPSGTGTGSCNLSKGKVTFRYATK